jgi:hypothetical protein
LTTMTARAGNGSARRPDVAVGTGVINPSGGRDF